MMVSATGTLDLDDWAEVRGAGMLVVSVQPLTVWEVCMAGSMVHMCIAMELMDMLDKWCENKVITEFEYTSGDTKYIYESEKNHPLLANEEEKALFLFGNVAPDNIMSREGYTRDMKMHTHFRDGIKDSEFGRRENLKIFHKRFYEFACKTLGIRVDGEGENANHRIPDDGEGGNANHRIPDDGEGENFNHRIPDDGEGGNFNLKIHADEENGNSNLVIGSDCIRSFVDSTLAPLYLGYLTHTITDEIFMLTIRPFFFECMKRKGLTTANPSNIPEIIRLFTLDTDAVDYYLSKRKPYIQLMKQYLSEAPSCCVEGYITTEEMEKSREWMLNRYFGEELSGLKASYVTENHMERFIRRVLNHIQRNLIINVV